MRISIKLTLVVAGALTVFVAIGGALVAYEEREDFERRTSVHGVLLGRVVASTVRETWEQRGEPGAREMIAAINAHEPSIRVRWVGLEPSEAVPGPRALDDRQRRELREGRVVTRARVEGEDVRYTYVPVPGSGRGIEIAESTAARAAHERAMLVRLVTFVLIGVGASLGLAFLVGRRLVGDPVARLVDVTERVGAGDLSVRAPADRNDELGKLGAAMNRMLDDLAEARAHIAREEEVRRNTEAQLRHAERLSTLGQLAAGVAHEIGTPLQSITMRAEIVDELAGEDADIRKHMEGIRAQCTKVRDTVQSLLRFGRRSTPRTGAVEVSHIVRQTVELVRAAFPKAGEVRVELPEKELTVEGDRDQLTQVLTNLVINALHASEAGEPVSVAALREDDCARMRVSDRGSGIPPDVLPHLFEPFFTTKEAGKGTGLGLSISYGIVRDHGGRIEVESEIGRGSTFDVVLPLAEIERQTQERRA